MNQPVPPQSAEEQLQQVQGIVQAHQQQVTEDIHQIITVGQANYGSRNFDEACQVVADALGTKSGQMMEVLRQFDMPHDVIMTLASDKRRLDQFAKLSPQRQAIEVARIEAQRAPYGHVDTGGAPAWKRPEARQGRVSDDLWRTTAGDSIKDDATWSREFDRRMAERSKRVR